MRITVKVKPNSRKNLVKKNENGQYEVSITAPPVDGKANEMMVEVLADFFNRPKRAFSILSGKSGKIKIVHIIE